MKRKILAAALGAVMLLSLAGCSAGACSLCGSTENTASYRNLSTNKNEALCEDCIRDAVGSPDECAFCSEKPAGFYVNMIETAVFACQECYDGL